MHTPSSAELEQGFQAFQQHEKRDAMYKVATYLVQHFWGKSAEMADGLGVLLLTWNQAHYRYGTFDFDNLEKCIASNISPLAGYRERNILSYSPVDDTSIKDLFQKFLDALRVSEGKRKGATSPVAAAKTLHLFAPAFFPLWDDKIARAYHCHYAYKPVEKYLTFLAKMKQIAVALHSHVDTRGTSKTLLKLIDEYNYARYTKHWVQ